MSAPPKCAARPFFLPTERGPLFCLFHPPHAMQAMRGAVLYVHPFGEEMNKSRRMAALHAKQLAAMGYGILRLDLYGCGDSSGELRDASWDYWKEDLRAAVDWLSNHCEGPLCLWGLRLGATLALDFARTSVFPIHRLLLWQPVISGEMFLSQFLRLKLAGSIISGGNPASTGARQLRDSLRWGVTLEIAGYDLSPPLASAMDALKLEELADAGNVIDWFEVVPEQGRDLPPAAKRVIDTWRRKSVHVNVHSIPGSAFWATQEVTECPELLAKSARIFAGEFA
ncbi:MAG: hydrolase 2, exosortase A system-associated [Bacillota bacterium]